MKCISFALLGLLLGLCISPGSGQTQPLSPAHNVQKLYENDRQGEGANYSAPTRKLLADCERCAPKNAFEIACPGINIFIMGQDTFGSLQDFKVVSQKVGPSSAVAVASFVNQRPTVIRFKLLKSGSGWVIDDMTGRQDLGGGKSNCANLVASLKRRDICS
ncbi:hypothetical protein [Bradyrhizobium sp. USDA 336]|uniref:hypothetical protein n=1 Tax=Bradyrhizobium sp. USDA 336 TaxID=3156311 RepID=UPI00383522A0